MLPAASRREGQLNTEVAMLHHILVVDDEEEVREGILLQLAGSRNTIL